MRLAVAATAPLGADVLERLAAKHDVAYLLTRPDRPRGRGRKLAPPPAKETAERLGLEVRQPERLDGFDPDVETVVVAAYGVLIPEALLDRALWLNVHPSLLPRWRGAAPIERALMAGDEESGVTIIELAPELDAGPIAAQRAFALSPEDDFGSVSARAGEVAADADGASRAAAEGIEPRERALAQRLAYGTIQRVRTLDHGIEQLGGRPVARLDHPVQAALRLGAYQLAYSEVAVHAAVHESVELVRAAGLERAVKFANAVMRRLTLGLPKLVEALPEETPEQAALRHSYPDWVAQVWWRDLGAEQARELMRAQNEPPERAVRLNARRRGPVVDGERDAEIPGALKVERIDDCDLAAGFVWPQSRGSQLAGLAVGAQPGEHLLDLCAAPGGKATQLAETAEEVVAVEKH